MHIRRDAIAKVSESGRGLRGRWRGAVGFRAALVALGGCLVLGCASRPPPRAGAHSPAALQELPARFAWTFASDVERLERLFPTEHSLWAATPSGLVAWRLSTGAFHAEVDPAAPGPEATSVVETSDQTVYVGLPSGLAWKVQEQPWQRSAEGTLAAGVEAIAPRAGGGVWIGQASGLSYFDAALGSGRLHLVNDRHRIRSFSVSPQGVVWAATDGFGVVRIDASAGPGQERLVEYTSGQGLCGNRIRSVFAGPGLQVGVTCLEAQAWDTFSLWEGGGFKTWQLRGQNKPIERAMPTGDRLVIVAGGVDLVLDRQVSKSPAVTDKSPAVTDKSPTPASGPTVVPFEGQPLVEPPLPSSPSVAPVSPPTAAPVSPPTAAPVSPKPSPSTPAPGGLSAELERLAAGGRIGGPAAGIILPAPVSMPAPVATPLPEVKPDLPLLVVRGAAAPGATASPLAGYTVRVEPSVLPVDVAVTAKVLSTDGMAYYALAHRGVLGVRNAERRRLSTQSLGGMAGAHRLSVDRQGRVYLIDVRGRLLSGVDGVWGPLAIDADEGVRPLAVAVDDADQVWVLAQKGIEPEVRVLKASPTQPFASMGRVAWPKLDGPAVIGDLTIDGRGVMVFPLFYRDKKGARRASGLARIESTLSAMEVVRADDGLSPPGTGELRLPDAWVSVVERLPGGDTLYLGTNSGVSRISATTNGGSIRTFGENDFLTSEVITDVAVEADGRLWVGTNEGLGYIETEAWHTVRQAGLRERIVALAADARGNLWVGTDTELYLGDKRGFSKLQMATAGFEVAGLVRDITADRQGGVWIATSQGLVHAEVSRTPPPPPGP